MTFAGRVGRRHARSAGGVVPLSGGGEGSGSGLTCRGSRDHGRGVGDRACDGAAPRRAGRGVVAADVNRAAAEETAALIRAAGGRARRARAT